MRFWVIWIKIKFILWAYTQEHEHKTAGVYTRVDPPIKVSRYSYLLATPSSTVLLHHIPASQTDLGHEASMLESHSFELHVAWTLMLGYSFRFMYLFPWPRSFFILMWVHLLHRKNNVLFVTFLCTYIYLQHSEEMFFKS